MNASNPTTSRGVSRLPALIHRSNRGLSVVASDADDALMETGTEDFLRSRGDVESFMRRALLLDLEVGTGGKLLKVGAVLGPRSFQRAGQFDLAQALRELAEFARDASFLLGHNLVDHDLPLLKKHHATHPLLALPVIDTLALSPICFPQNPYHRLVKDYKLVRESVNNPVADARLAGVLFRDEFEALHQMHENAPERFVLLHFLLAADPSENPAAAGMELLFGALGGEIPTAETALNIARHLLPQWGCSLFPVTPELIETPEARMALAYALAWLPFAGSNSVIPPWVRAKHPRVLNLIERLRETPCSKPACEYCGKAHHPETQLRHYFGFDQFRSLPANASGGSLQRDIVEAGFRNDSLLAILPTGGGKSICFQLPALVRNFRRGSLTIVISPLQALMKDQVDGLTRRTGTPFAAALYGMLTPPERADVLRRVALGDIAILYVSPEQLRNRSFENAIRQREISCWVFDEAHCFSKWGHDFRCDYLYAGRFIREFSASTGAALPSIACFTATAKLDVKSEILEFFRVETGRQLALFEGGVERNNLRFEVSPASAPEKLERIHHLLSEQFSLRSSGSAIVFRARRDSVEKTAEFLRSKDWRVAHFHAGLTPSEKKEIQDGFLNGDLQVICATNAFGMGIDKEDVRLVIHGDTPGSLENYLQEAGRAGRDQQLGRCILLFDEEDAETQFRMAALSQLTRRDIAQILRTLRKARRDGANEVVLTTGEILRHEEYDGGIDLDGRDADTKVRTAVSWLERSGFLRRDENVTSVFQARVLVKDLAEAEVKLAALNLSESERSAWKGILRAMMNADPAKPLSVDQLALLPEFASYLRPDFENGPRSGGRLAVARGHDYLSGRILKILKSMAESGLVKRDTLLSAFLHYKVANHSGKRLERALLTERKLVDLLALADPDPEGWVPLFLPRLNQQLADEGVETSPEFVRQLLASLADDGRGFAGTQGSIDLRFISRESYRVRVNRSWSAITELAEKRRRASECILQRLLAKVTEGTAPQSDLLVNFSFEELELAIEADLFLRGQIKDKDSAIERALMFLHEQRVVNLQQGLAVFRSAMTIRFDPAGSGEPYKKSDYQPLDHYYKERIFQVHIMGEYARLALVGIQEALKLVLAYFTLGKEEFIRRFFGARKKEFLEHATTAESFQRIVTSLRNQAQIRIVTAPVTRDMLVLAGPGSGKSRVVVHRCAYLLRVERVRPQSILVCCFNRQAAIDLRQRLRDLAGDDARGVLVSTYHGLAMRLLGYSFSGARNPGATEEQLRRVIPDAVALLRGERPLPGLEPDEARDRLLAGFSHILVDEYQDIDEEQYDLISAIAGRTQKDSDLRLSIMAVGDDDQNIYTFRGANVSFIRRFQEDYKAELHYLVENYRSTRHLIAAANELIERNNDRMKKDHPIRIDSGRHWLPLGGDFASLDPASEGRVRLLRLPDELALAANVIAELKRLRKLGAEEWSSIAVLARSHSELAQVRAAAERENIPVRWCPDRRNLPSLHQIREIHDYLRWARSLAGVSMKAAALIEKSQPYLARADSNHWTAFIRKALEEWRVESMDAELPLYEFIEFLWMSCVESRRNINYGSGVTLSTIHAAKGTEHNHVLLTGSWPLRADAPSIEEDRRLLYVGMTRARHTLALFETPSRGLSLLDALESPVLLREAAAAAPPSAVPASIEYHLLGLDDLYLSYAARFAETHPVHRALARFEPGAPLTLRDDPSGVAVLTPDAVVVGRLSRKGSGEWKPRLAEVREVRLLALIRRTSEQTAAAGLEIDCMVPEWLVPVLEVITEKPARS